MKPKKTLIDEDGEIREITKADMAEMLPFSELPASLQTKLKKVGRPVLENKKKVVSIRLDPDVLEAIKATGDGWQTRINDMLRRKFIHR